VFDFGHSAHVSAKGPAVKFRFLAIVFLVPLLVFALAGPASSRTRRSSVLHGLGVVSATDIWGSGYFLSGGVAQGMMQHWNGTAWSIVSSPNPGPGSDFLNDIAVVASNDVWVVGDRDNTSASEATGKTLIEHWNGTAWSVVPTPNPGSGANILRGAAAASANDVWAAGFYNNGSSNRTLIEHWNGSAWSVVPSPNGSTDGNYLSGLAVVSSTDVWAAGSYTIGGVYRTLILHWDGTTWSIASTPNPGTGTKYPQGALLRTVTATGSNDAWAVGRYWDGTRFRNLALHWNGTAWTQSSTVDVGTHDNELRGVAAVPSSAAWWSVGYYSDGTTDHTLSERWNGSSWTRVATVDAGTGGSYLKGIAPISASNAWAAGYFVSSGLYRTLVEHWDGASWKVVSSPNA
jgi:hypothetical protein